MLHLMAFLLYPGAGWKEQASVTRSRHDAELAIFLIPHLIEPCIPVKNVRKIKPCSYNIFA